MFQNKDYNALKPVFHGRVHENRVPNYVQLPKENPQAKQNKKQANDKFIMLIFKNISCCFLQKDYAVSPIWCQAWPCEKFWQIKHDQKLHGSFLDRNFKIVGMAYHHPSLSLCQKTSRVWNSYRQPTMDTWFEQEINLCWFWVIYYHSIN